MLKKKNAVLTGLLFLLAIPLVPAFEANTASYSVDSFHLGTAGNNGSTSSYTFRSTTTYEQGSNSDVTTATYSANSGWFNIDITTQQVGPTQIGSCTTISVPGEYVLTTDIIDSGATKCIEITSSNVIFDGAGYSITGLDSNTGIYVYSGTNVTVRNVRVTGWQYGIYYRSVENGNIENNTASSNNIRGISLWSSSNNTIANNNASNNGNNGITYERGYGIYLSSSSNNTLTNNTVNSNNGWYDWGYGIYLWSSSNYNILIDNNASNNQYGIRFDSSSGNTLTNNTASNNQYGIRFDSSSGNTLTNNTASNNGRNGWGYGIYINSSSNNIVTDNTAKENNYYENYRDVYVLATSDVDCNIIMENNTVSEDRQIKYFNYSVSLQNEVIFSELILCNADNSNIDNVTIMNNNGLYVLRTDNSSFTNIDSSNNVGIRLYFSSSNTIANNNASNNGGRIGLDYSSNNIITNNNQYGIYLKYSSNNTIANNNASNTGIGIRLYFSSSNTIANNTANSNNEFGILLFLSSNNTIANNNASNNKGSLPIDDGHGIYLSSSSNNTIANNNANSNTWEGIVIRTSSNYNSLTNNTVNSNSREGIRLVSSSNYNSLTDNIASNNNYGILLWSSSNTLTNNTFSNNRYGIYLISSSNNITNNYFNNTDNFYLYSSTNTWNTAKTLGTNIIGGPNLGGNFWAKLDGTGFSETCTDADSDGICDSNYTLASGNVDYLPLAVYAPDSTPPSITFVSPTDPSSTTLTTRSYTYINVTLSESGTAWLEWNGTNESMSGSGASWYLNKTGLTNGVYTYKVYANDTAGNLGVSETRTVTINFSADVTFSIPSYKQRVGRNITMPVTMNTTTNVGSIQLDLLYDSSVINATSVAQGSAASGALFVPTINNSAGRITIGIISISGLSTNGSIADITFNVTAIGGNFTDLTLVNQGVTDPVNNELAVTLYHGNFTVYYRTRGDANDDDTITAADALLYLRYAVGQDISPYYLDPAGDDVTCDGRITAADALRVLRKAVGQDVDLEVCP